MIVAIEKEGMHGKKNKKWGADRRYKFEQDDQGRSHQESDF